MATKKLLKLPEQPKAVHQCAPALKQGVIECVVVGCGGNGSQMLTRLARLDHALRECGHPGGIHVTAYDPDLVSRANVGRQMFSPSDIGHNKAVVLVSRINAFYGLDWVARAEKFGEDREQTSHAPAAEHIAGKVRFPQLLVTCVDTAKTRREIGRHIEKADRKPVYWLDLGNKKSDGQVILGQPKGTVTMGTAPHLPVANWSARDYLETLRLPMVTEVFPELLNPKLKETNEPSCSLADALAKQSLFVNDHISAWAAELLDQLLRRGEITHHGAFINLETGRVNPLAVPMPTPVEKPGARAVTKRVAA